MSKSTFMATFVGGPLDGQTRFVNQDVDIVVYADTIEIVPGWEYDWLFGGFVWRSDSEPDLSKPPATYKSVTYRRYGNRFVMYVETESKDSKWQI